MIRARAMLGGIMLFAVVAGLLGHHDTPVQWGAALAGCFLGGLIKE